MKTKDYIMAKDGFVGHLYQPENQKDRAVVVILGGEQSLMPAKYVAQRFADYGIMAVTVALFGAEGLPEGVNLIPLEMAAKAVVELKKRGAKQIAVYGMSMGSIAAAYAAKYIPDIDTVIMCSPSHAAFEGTVDKKHMSGHSMLTWMGEELPFVKPDFTHKKMYQAFKDAYQDKVLEEKAAIPIEQLKARLLFIASEGDESWPAAYSVGYMKERLTKNNYAYPFKVLLFKESGHLIGIMPKKEEHKWLYRLMPLTYARERKNRKACDQARLETEKAIIDWIMSEE